MDKKPLNRFERRKLETRNKLKAAAIQLILEKGYETITIQDITDQADLARATFYIHYKDKEDLLWDAIRVGWENFPLKLKQIQEGQRDKPALYYGLLFDFTLANENRDLYKIILGGLGPNELVERAKKNISADIKDGISSGEFQLKIDLPPEITAEFIVGAVTELITWWLNKPNNYSCEQMADIAYKLCGGIV